MTRDELREKVARAMAEADSGTPADMVFDGAPWWQQWLPEADAALRVVREAMREPTPRMCMRAEDVAGVFGAVSGPRIYSAMLAASPLAEPSP